MDISYFIGIDISKATLDWAVFDGKHIVLQTQSENTETGIKAAIKFIKTLPNFKVTQTVCCMEQTGIYTAHLLACLHKLSFPIWLDGAARAVFFANQKSRRSTAGQERHNRRPAHR